MLIMFINLNYKKFLFTDKIKLAECLYSICAISYRARCGQKLVLECDVSSRLQLVTGSDCLVEFVTIYFAILYVRFTSL